ncbi:hypothetical protein [Mycoplasmopsis bovirhinis]|uniref:hypothetical protein n=1 Tax=Mycoplasmopsis bovirhinis TaxID=29553 RepID=UPI000E760BAA|nr:hypothetical protein [Mycoplasmopsis bovirhinis]
MKFKKKNILLASGAIITAAAWATAIVYSNVQKTKALSPLLIPGMHLALVLLGFLQPLTDMKAMDTKKLIE